MADLIENIILLKHRLSDLQAAEFGIKGNIENLNSSDISVIKKIWEFIDEFYNIVDNETIYIEDINNYISANVRIEIKTGNVPGYYNTSKDFLSGNKIKCVSTKFYIEELNYIEGSGTIIPPIIQAYKLNIEIISLLSEIADYKKELGNKLELFFYKSEKGVSLDIDYNEDDLKNFKAVKIPDLKAQLLNSIDSVERKQLFVNELISDLDKNGNSYSNLLKDWEAIIGNYEKSFKLYLSGFSFDKIKTSSLEYFQKLTDRLYDSINKVSSYIFGIPIGYILLINNYDFKGEQIIKNAALLILGVLFFLIMWFVFFKNIDESISAIEADIKKFREKIDSKSELKEVTAELLHLEQTSIKNQKKKLLLVKILSGLILVITILVFLMIFLRTNEKLNQTGEGYFHFVKVY